MKEMTPNELIEYSNNSKCILIDVRTEREWETVGKPDGDQIGLKTYFVSIKNNEGSLNGNFVNDILSLCLLYTSPSPRDRQKSRMPSSA